MDLGGKVALVTGGSGDIDRSQALAVRHGRCRCLCRRCRPRGHGGRDGAQGRPPGPLPCSSTSATPKSIESCVGEMMDRFGRIDILVNNGAWNIGIPFGELDALTQEIWDRILEDGLRGPFLLSRAFASGLRRHKAGRIVNIASLAGLAPGGSSIAYASSKAALIHLTCLAVALAPDVTVNCIAPGLVEGTRMAERVPQAMKEQIRTQSVLGRTGSADDIAQMVVAYCRADSITGQTTVVDGGNPIGMR